MGEKFGGIRFLSGAIDFAGIFVFSWLCQRVIGGEGTYAGMYLPALAYAFFPLTGKPYPGQLATGLRFVDANGELPASKAIIRFFLIAVALIVLGIFRAVFGSSLVGFAGSLIFLQPAWALMSGRSRQLWWDKIVGANAARISNLSEGQEQSLETDISAEAAPQAGPRESMAPAVVPARAVRLAQVEAAPQSAFHDEAYAKVAQEFSSKTFDQALLIRATNEGGTDKEAVKAIYIRLRVEKLVAELRARAVEEHRLRTEHARQREELAQKQRLAEAAELARAQELATIEKKRFLNSDRSKAAISQFLVCQKKLQTTPDDMIVLLIIAFFFAPFLETMLVAEVIKRFGAGETAASELSTAITISFFAVHAVLGFAVHFLWKKRWLATAQEARCLLPIVRQSAEAGSDFAGRLLAQPILKIAKVVSEDKSEA